MTIEERAEALAKKDFNKLNIQETVKIRKAKIDDAPAIHRTEKQIDVLRAKVGRTAQARARARKAE